MAYIDLTIITDAEAESLIARDPVRAANALQLAEDDVIMASNAESVPEDKILFDDITGFIVSKELYRYCLEMFYYHLYGALANIIDEEDLYTQMMLKAEVQARKYEDKLSYLIITQEEVTDSSSRNTGFDILH